MRQKEEMVSSKTSGTLTSKGWGSGVEERIKKKKFKRLIRHHEESQHPHYRGPRRRKGQNTF